MARANPIQVQECLSGMDYPADKEEIINHAKDQGADEDVMQTLQQLPEQDYRTAADVSRAIGQIQ
ncbi:DUF2795 domain-containing protein [Candidatus Methylomicrobium oryzae]|jgi:hypothetical protein|uniref:DUF2795 domain-containing protein n=1 Tax=Candidatus Methylomicrobium oryzae TaxID=2802053 RepID=UPI001922077F|nr:DUF2795 domain-containing protein [Methylomicrobium sp. RS1]MBL1263053.1 DUF2795 domain-containing protein [Methylomicrobium sp. RS1]